MEIQQAIFTRRSIRKYTDTPIADGDIQDILRAGMAAPSAVNLQPWYMVAIRTKEARAELLGLMRQMPDRMEPILKDRFPNHPQVVNETCRFLDNLGNAPLCMLAFQYKEYDKKQDAIVQSVSAAIQNMLLMAETKGIGSCWLTAPLETGLDGVLQDRYAPDKGKLVALLTFGYAAEQPREPKRKDDRYVIL